MVEEKEKIKRRQLKISSPTAGRPPIEELMEVTADMENVAHLVATGNTATEIAEILKWTTEKTLRYIKLPLVVNRIKLLLGDPLIDTQFKRRRLEVGIKDSLIRKANADLLSEGTLLQLHKMLDPYERMEILTNDEKRLLKDKKQLTEGDSVVGSNKPKSIFAPKEEE